MKLLTVDLTDVLTFFLTQAAKKDDKKKKRNKGKFEGGILTKAKL